MQNSTLEVILGLNPLLSSCIFIVLGSIVLLVKRNFSSRKEINLPPGLPAWPVIGSFPSLLKMPSDPLNLFCALSRRFGPISYFHMGKHPVVVVASAELAEEVLRLKDAETAHRPSSEILRLASTYMGFNCEGLVFSDSNAQFWFIKKLLATETFSVQKISATAQIRLEEMRHTIQLMVETTKRRETINIRKAIHVYMADITSRILFGESLGEMNIPGVTVHSVVEHFIAEQGRLSTSYNATDLCPALDFLDPQGLIGRYKQLNLLMKKHFGLIISHRRQLRAEKGGQDCLLDTLINLRDEGKISEDTLFGVMNETLSGGIESAATTAEWTMLELLRHPEVLEKVQAEIDVVVGSERPVQDDDIKHLHCLQNAVKEAFRLYPPAPLLLPHLNLQPNTIGGYDIPARTSILINIYDIQRSPDNYGPRASEFDPSRFETEEGQKIGVTGSSYKLLPFGSGRRKCPGYALGLLNAQRTVASMLHSFYWYPPPGKTAKDLGNAHVLRTNLVPEETLFLTAVPRPTAQLYVNKSK